VKEFFQTKNESVVINGEITVTVADIVGDQVMLAIDAPEWMRVCESEKVEEREVLDEHPMPRRLGIGTIGAVDRSRRLAQPTCNP
jgi:carbon storage regulator CsrA